MNSHGQIILPVHIIRCVGDRVPHMNQKNIWTDQEPETGRNTDNTPLLSCSNRKSMNNLNAFQLKLNSIR